MLHCHHVQVIREEEEGMFAVQHKLQLVGQMEEQSTVFSEGPSQNSNVQMERESKCFFV